MKKELLQAKTVRRGPKKKPLSEIKVPIKIWVKAKYVNKASKEMALIEEKYQD
jgi:hypothetical protein